MRYFGMPMGMWALFAGSFRRELTSVFGYDPAAAKKIARAPFCNLSSLDFAELFLYNKPV